MPKYISLNHRLHLDMGSVAHAVGMPTSQHMYQKLQQWARYNRVYIGPR